jgi:PhnB protein
MSIEMTRKLPRPAGHHSLTPGFSVKGASKVIAFLERAFGGKVVDKYEGPGGVVFHAEVMIGDSVVMLGDASAEAGDHPAMPAMVSFYVDSGAEVDVTYGKALAHGATSLRAPENQFYGYRSATVEDAGGNRWTICAVIEDLTKEQIEQRVASMAPPKG